MNVFTTIRVTCLCVAAALGSAMPTMGTTIFSQTPPSDFGGSPSDTRFAPGGFQMADDFTVGPETTLRSASWRGFYATGNSPAFPLSFSVIIYSNGLDNLPDTANVLSTTAVDFSSAGQIVDTGINPFKFDVYEYRADLFPTPLTAGTKYWFSIYADMSNDADDVWFWTTAGVTGSPTASRSYVTSDGPFALQPNGQLFFVLDDAAVPEPVSLALCGMGALALLRQRRRRDNPGLQRTGLAERSL